MCLSWWSWKRRSCASSTSGWEWACWPSSLPTPSWHRTILFGTALHMGWTLLCKNEDHFGSLVLAHEVAVEGDKSKIMNVSVHILACWCIQTCCCFLPQAGMILGKWTYNSTHLHSFILYNYWFNRLSWSMLFNLGHGSYKISEKNHSWDYSACDPCLLVPIFFLMKLWRNMGPID